MLGRPRCRGGEARQGRRGRTLRPPISRRARGGLCRRRLGSAPPRTRGLSVEFRLSRGLRVGRDRRRFRPWGGLPCSAIRRTLGLVGESAVASRRSPARFFESRTHRARNPLRRQQYLQLAGSDFPAYARLQMVFQDRTARSTRAARSGNRRRAVEDPHEQVSIGDSRRGNSILEAVGLDQRFLSRRPQELSGGQRQRVASLVPWLSTRRS